MIPVIPDNQYALNKFCIKLFNIYIQLIYVFDEYYCSFIDYAAFYNGNDTHFYKRALTPKKPYKNCKAFYCYIPFINKVFNIEGIIQKIPITLVIYYNIK